MILHSRGILCGRWNVTWWAAGSSEAQCEAEKPSGLFRLPETKQGIPWPPWTKEELSKKGRSQGFRVRRLSWAGERGKPGERGRRSSLLWKQERRKEGRVWVHLKNSDAAVELTKVPLSMPSVGSHTSGLSKWIRGNDFLRLWALKKELEVKISCLQCWFLDSCQIFTLK